MNNLRLLALDHLAQGCPDAWIWQRRMIRAAGILIEAAQGAVPAIQTIDGQAIVVLDRGSIYLLAQRCHGHMMAPADQLVSQGLNMAFGSTDIRWIKV